MGKQNFFNKVVNSRSKLGFVVLLLIILLTVILLSLTNNSSNVQIANPSAVKCIEDGYEYEIRTDSDGSQTGYCILPDGTECEGWSYYWGDC